MTTSGMYHFSCHARKYDKTGSLIWENKSFQFKAKDALKHLEKLKNSYASHGMQFEWFNLTRQD